MKEVDVKLNTAQKLVASWLGIDPDFWDVADKRLAVEQTNMMASRYLAPHAQHGTSARLHKPRLPEYVFSKLQNKMIIKRRPFKGHRP
jgi:hypothetical protein